mmetsp:Transcript_54655/g.131005  ORF Transcript_54655/g.131005 Transcript_54655/m.131005 type:complete len:332 (-) Transcript_54655:245-1240(-)
MAQKWSTWGGVVGEIRCARCGGIRSGSGPHTCDIVQEQTHKVETSPMARSLLRRRTKELAMHSDMNVIHSPASGPHRPPWVQKPPELILGGGGGGGGGESAAVPMSPSGFAVPMLMSPSAFCGASPEMPKGAGMWCRACGGAMRNGGCRCHTGRGASDRLGAAAEPPDSPALFTGAPLFTPEAGYTPTASPQPAAGWGVNRSVGGTLHAAALAEFGSLQVGHAASDASVGWCHPRLVPAAGRSPRPQSPASSSGSADGSQGSAASQVSQASGGSQASRDAFSKFRRQGSSREVGVGRVAASAAGSADLGFARYSPASSSGAGPYRANPRSA